MFGLCGERVQFAGTSGGRRSIAVDVLHAGFVDVVMKITERFRGNVARSELARVGPHATN